jgi:hypothetical protein
MRGGEDRIGAGTEKANGIRTEIQVLRAGDIEDVQEEVEVMAFTAKGNVFYKTNVEICKIGLRSTVASNPLLHLKARDH